LVSEENEFGESDKSGEISPRLLALTNLTKIVKAMNIRLV